MAHRKTRRIYDKALVYENVYAAWKTVSHTCKNRRGVFEFSMFAHVRVAKILDELKNRTYYPNKYRCFMIFEPKPRLVMSQSIRDKAVNHFVANEYLIPLLDPSLIYTNVATRKGAGSSRAMKMLKRYISQMMAERPGEKIYVAKIDIAKFFYTIDHEILFNKLKLRIKDSDVIELLKRIIDETNKPYINKIIDRFNVRYGTDIPHYENNKGLSIGAVTSQFLAIYYLNDLDWFIKEELGCRYLIRYMDDILILGFDKQELYRIMEIVGMELEKLKLKVNPKSAVYNCCSLTGFPFLGYRYYMPKPGVLKIKPLAKTVKRIRLRLSMLSEYDPDKYLRSRAAYKGYFMHAVPEREMNYVIEKNAEFLLSTFLCSTILLFIHHW